MKSRWIQTKFEEIEDEVEDNFGVYCIASLLSGVAVVLLYAMYVIFTR